MTIQGLHKAERESNAKRVQQQMDDIQMEMSQQVQVSLF